MSIELPTPSRSPMLLKNSSRALLSAVITSISLFALSIPAYPAGTPNTDLQVLGNSIAVAARHDFLHQLAKSSTRPSNLEFHIDPLFDKSLTHEVIVDTQLSSDFWAGIRPVDQKVEVYIAPTDDMNYLMTNMWPTLNANGQYGDWLPEKVAHAKIDHGFYGGGAPAYDKFGRPVFMMYAPNNISQGYGFWTQGTSHEFTHLIQRYIMDGDFAPLYGWVVEGQADYIGANIGARNSTTAFASYWAQLIQSMKKNSSHPEMLTWNSQQFVKWFKDQENTHAPSAAYKGDIALESYVFGALAFQYLYGTYGFDAVTNYYENLAKMALSACVSAEVSLYPQCTIKRHEAFQSAFGISTDDFYSKVAPFVVQEIKWSQTAIKKLPLDLLKIAPAAWANTPLQALYIAPEGLGPIPEYGNLSVLTPGGLAPSTSGSGNQTPSTGQQGDPYPPNIPAPNRSCPNNDGAHATLYGGGMTCVNGTWTLDPGQTIGKP